MSEGASLEKRDLANNERHICRSVNKKQSKTRLWRVFFTDHEPLQSKSGAQLRFSSKELISDIASNVVVPSTIAHSWESTRSIASRNAVIVP